MIILSHRGYWKTANEKNQLTAFKRSFDLHFGTETDLRDHAGKLVISHDIPLGNELSFDEFISVAINTPSLPLALNIKADGLAESLTRIMKRTPLTDWFVFDMSVPDMRHYLKLNVPVFTRISEIEQHPVCLDRAAGVWLDAFTTEWYRIEDIKQLLERKVRVCVVSPELHQRDYLPLWQALRVFVNTDQVLLCTDFPEEAQLFFMKG